MSVNHTLGEIAETAGGAIVGDAETVIDGLGSLASARAGQISHLSSPSYKPLLATTQASAVIVKADDVHACPSAALVVDNPYLTFARVSQMFKVARDADPGVDKRAVIHPTAQVHPTAHIAANVVVGARTDIAANVVVYSNSAIGEDCHIDADTEIRANVTLYGNVTIGERCTIHSGAVIGADGFGFTADNEGKWQAIAQLAGVRIGSDVSIGANTCIDCGAIEDTVIEDGVQIDNLVQIGHNCRIGAHTLLCGVVAIAGSSTVGKHCVFAGRAGIGGDHPIDICDGVIVSSNTTISQSVDTPGVYSGSILFHEHNKWRRNALRFSALDDLFKRVRRLEKKQR